MSSLTYAHADAANKISQWGGTSTELLYLAARVPELAMYEWRAPLLELARRRRWLAAALWVWERPAAVLAAALLAMVAAAVAEVWR